MDIEQLLYIVDGENMNKPSANISSNSLVKIGQASKILGVSMDTLRRWEKAGKIRVIRTPGGTRLYQVDSIKELGKQPSGPVGIHELLQNVAEEENVFSFPVIPAQAGIQKEDGSPSEGRPIKSGMPMVPHFLINSLLILTIVFLVGLTSFGLTKPELLKQIFPSSLLQNLSKDNEKEQVSDLLPENLRGSVLAVTAAPNFLEINTDVQINGTLSVRDEINDLEIVSAPTESVFQLISGSTALTVEASATLDQDVSTTSSPTFNSLTLTGNKINQLTLPSATDTLVGKNTTDTFTNKSISGSTNTLTNIPNSALTNSKVTISAGSNLTGGGDVSLGSSITVSLKDSIELSGTLKASGATTLSSTLAVSGATTLSSTLSVAGNVTPSANVTYSLGSSSLRWLKVWAEDGDFSDDVRVGDALTVEGSLTVSGTTLATTGNIETSGNLTVDGNSTLGNATSDSTTITGTTTINLPDNTDNALDIQQGTNNYINISTTDTTTSLLIDLPVAGSSSTTANLFTSAISKTINFGDSASTNTIDIGGVTNSGTDTISIGTNSTAADIITLGNTNSSTTLALTGGDDWSISTGGDAVFDGSVDIGDTAADTITFSGVVDSNFVADANNTRNLGSSSVRWATIYGVNGNFTNIEGTVVTGSTSAATWTINSDNATDDAEISAVAFDQGTATFNSVMQWNASGDAGRVTGYDDNFLFNYPISLFSQVSGGNQTFTSGSLFNYGQNATHAITQSGAFVGLDIDFSSNITNTTQNQTGALVTLKDGSSSGTAIGFQTAGTFDIGLDIGGTPGTADIRLSNGETISNLVNGTVAIGTTTLQLTGGTTLVSDQATVALFNTTTTTLNVGGAATTINLGPTGSGASSIVMSGGSADTGCTLDGSTGNFTCAGNITGSSSGTVGFWSRSGTTLTTATADDLVSLDSNLLFKKEVAHTIQISDTTTADTVGGALTIKSAAGVGTGAGGALALTAGAGGSTGTGGAVSITAGKGGSTAYGGAVNITSGGSTGFPAGDIILSIPTPDATNNAGGNITGTAGAGTGSSTGGNITWTAGAGSTGTGGAASLIGGAGSTGGAAVITGGAANGASVPGGAVTITSGRGAELAASSNSGAITIASGAVANDWLGSSGAITIQSAVGSNGVTAATIGGASGAMIFRSQAGGNATTTATGGASGALTISTGAGGTTGTGTAGAGGTLSITGGAGGTASSTGTGGAGSTISITAGAAGSAAAGGTGGAAGAITLQAGAGALATTGGAVTLAAGQGGATGTGGAITINSGAGGSTSGASGALTLATGIPVATNNSGAISITTGASSSSGTSSSGTLTLATGAAGGTGESGEKTTGNINITVGGTGGAYQVQGGAVNITAGHSSGSSRTGGAISLSAGNGDPATPGGIGGAVNISGGTGYFAKAGGALVLTGGTPGATGIGGAITLTTGAGGSTSGASGALTLNTGAVVSGTPGVINIGTANTQTINLGLTGSGTSSIVMSGGSADTGCTLDGSNGNLTCSGNVTGSSSGTVGFWSRSGTTLTTATADDIVSLDTNLLFKKEVAHTIQISDTTTADTAGGALTIKSAAGLGTGAGGALALAAGAGGASGTGGAVTLAAGAGGSSAGVGGAITITAGASSATSVAGGALTLTSGAAQGSGTGASGNVSISSGISSGNNAATGTVSIASGNPAGNGADTNSGALTIASGTPGKRGNSGAITIQSGAAVAADAGDAGGVSGAIILRSQAGGAGGTIAAGGASGSLTLSTGTGGGTATGTAGAGGTVSLTGGNGGAASGVGTGGAGAGVSITGGTGGAASGGGSVGGVGGSVTIAAGVGGAADAGGAGGALSLSAGNAGANSLGAGGSVSITAGDADVGSAGVRNGGSLTLTAGLGKSSGSGGDIALTAAAAGASGGFGGAITLTAGESFADDRPGGEIALVTGAGGDGSAAGAGGAFTVNTGIGGSTAAGGAITFAIGAGGASSAAAGGAFTVTAGTGGATGVGGAITLTTGAGGSTSGGSGALTLDTGAVTSGTVGAINIGTSARARTITIGNSTDATALALTSGTGSQTFTSSVATGTTTTSGFVFDATAITTGTGGYLTTDSVTTGRLLDIATTGNTWLGNGTTNGLINIASTSTAGTGSSSSILLNLARSGTNANATHTAYGVYSAVTNTGTTSTNVAGYFSATGATTNYGIHVDDGGTRLDGQLSVGDNISTTTHSLFNPTFTAATGATGTIVRVAGTLTADADDGATTVHISPTIVEAGSGNHALLTGVRIDTPVVTGGAATVTDTASLYIQSASTTATVSGANYALWVDAGTSRFDGAVAYGAQATFTDLDATPDVSAGSHFITNTSAVTITDFDAGSGTLANGHIIYVESNGAITYDCNPFANLNCGGGDIVTAAKDLTAWIYDGTDWTLVNWMKNASTQTGADLAEWYVSFEDLEPGDIVSISNTSKVGSDSFEVDPTLVEKSKGSYEEQVMGIVSTDPGIILGPQEQHTFPIALAGRVPTKVSTENGPIQRGDYLTSSSIPGVAMKATKPGQVIGKALEDYSCSTSEESKATSEVTGTGSSDGECFGKIMTFVNVSFADPGNFLASLSLDDGGNLIAPKFTTESLIINDHITVSAPENSILSYQPQVSLSGVSFGIDVASSLRNLEAKVIEIADNQATASGQLAEIKDTVTENKNTTINLAAQLASAAATLAETKSTVESLNLTPPDGMLATGSAALVDLTVTSEATFSGQLVAYDLSVQNIFKSLGETILGNTTVAGDVTIDGTFSISGSSLNALPVLYIQNSSLAEKVDLFNGKVVIDNTGTLIAQTVVTDQLRINSDKSSGTSIIKAGQTEILVENSFTEDSSIILVTPHTPLSQTLAVTEKTNGSFKVKLSTTETEDISFSYLIVGQGEKLSSN